MRASFRGSPQHSKDFLDLLDVGALLDVAIVKMLYRNIGTWGSAHRRSHVSNARYDAVYLRILLWGARQLVLLSFSATTNEDKECF